jgi:hypothetical protein
MLSDFAHVRIALVHLRQVVMWPIKSNLHRLQLIHEFVDVLLRDLVSLQLALDLLRGPI